MLIAYPFKDIRYTISRTKMAFFLLETGLLINLNFGLFGFFENTSIVCTHNATAIYFYEIIQKKPLKKRTNKSNKKRYLFDMIYFLTI